jgi:cytohesin
MFFTLRVRLLLAVVASFLLASAVLQVPNLLLAKALEMEWLAAVRFLVRTGANVNVKSSDGDTALLLACLYDDEDLAISLIGRGADVNARGSGQCLTGSTTPLGWAVGSGNTRIVRALLEHGADVHVTFEGPLSGYTPLLIAATAAGPEIVEALLARGADGNARGVDGMTALMLAARSGAPGNVQLLIERGADVNARGAEGFAPLTFAAWSGAAGSVQLLIEHGADVNARTAYGHTALKLARSKHRSEVVRLLEKAGARE